MKHRWPTVLVLLALLLNSGAAMALVERSNHSAAGTLTTIRPMTVRIALASGAGSIDPAYGEMPLITNQLFSGLTSIDPDTNLPVPDLATSWSISLDKIHYTFTLRRGLKWSNGTPLTASDVRYGILRSLDPATASGDAYLLYAIKNAQEYHEGSITNPALVGVTAPNSTQVKFTLKDPASYFPATLAMAVARPTPKLIIDAWGTAWTEPQHIVTSGPYRLKEWVHGDHFLLDKFSGFYDAANVKIQHISAIELDPTTAWNLFQSGGLDMVEVPLSELPAVKANPALSPLLHASQRGCTALYGFSLSQAPFDLLLVRKAFIAAINRQEMVDDLLAGGPQAGQTFTPPGVFGYVDGVAEGVGIPYDPALAKQLLAQAGYPGGEGLPPITFWFSRSTTNQKIAEYMQQNWSENLGVTVSLVSLSPTDYSTQLNNGTFQIWRQGWCAEYNDAYNFLNDAVLSYMPGRFGGWSNPTYANLLSQAAQFTDDALRQLLYRQAEEILVETDAVVAPLYHNSSPILTRAYLQRRYSIDTHIRDWALITTSSTLSSTGARDGWILESSEVSEVGGTMNANQATFALGDDAADRQGRSILSFNTSGLPDNAVITSVTLKIRGAGVVGTSPFITHGDLLVDVRKGAFSGNAALQLQDFQALASKNGALVIKSSPVDGWYSGAMGAANFLYINKTGLTQLRLRFAEDDNDDLGLDYIKFYSGDYATAAYRPKLVIRYYAP